MSSDKRIRHWVPNNSDGMFDRMQGDFFYIADKMWWQENRIVIDGMLQALSNIKIISYHCFLTDQGLYIDATLPTQDS